MIISAGLPERKEFLLDSSAGDRRGAPPIYQWSQRSDEPAEWLLMVHGAARGTPGDAGCGTAICDESGAVVKELSRYLGRTTHNVKVLYQRALTLLRQFDSYRILHVYREMNKVADRLAHRGIDEASGR